MKFAWDRIAVACAAALAVAMLALRMGGGVETDLYGLADARHGGVLKELAEGLSGQGRVLVEGPEREPPFAVAADVARELGQDPAPPRQ